jgi:MFS family permease
VSTPAQREPRAFAANVRRSYLYSFLMDFSLSAPIWVLYLRDQRGFSLTQITLMEVPLFLLIVLAEVPTGAVADRFGRKVSLMLASAILTFSMLVYGLATSYAVILVSNLAWGLSFTFRSGADTALLYDSLKQIGREAEFQRITGRFWALRSAAMLGGLLAGAPIAAATSYSFAIVLSALVSTLAFPLALRMHEPIQALAHAHEPYLRTLASGVRDAWRRPQLRWVFLYSGLIGAGAAGPLLLLQQPWLAAHGVATAELGVWQAAVQAVGIGAALGAAWLLSKLGERGAYLALLLALSLCSAALAGFDGIGVAAAFLGVAVVCGMHNPALAGYVNRLVESSHRATVLSVQSVAGNVAMALAWPLAGVIADARGLQAAFGMYASGVLLLGGAALLLWSRAERAAGVPG